MGVSRKIRWVVSLGLVPANVVAAPILAEVGEVDGIATQSITWSDAGGEPRTVHVRTNNHHITRYEYVVDGDAVVDDEAPGYGIGILVNHGSCGATNTLEGLSDYSAEAVLSGPHHYIWASTFRLAMCDHPDVTWRVTNHYVFVTGEDHFIQTVTYDSSDLPDSEPIGEDMRGPYNQTTWPGTGNISGFGWGSEYKFVTEGAIGAGDANVGGGVQVPWSWNEPNSIPYVWAWADPALGGAVDREYGIVQNQPYTEQDFGGGYFGCGSDCFASTPPVAGAALPAAWAMPSQMSSYDSNYRSGRITWGQTYGTFENGHSNDTGSIPDMGDHFRPVNAWSFTHVIGKYTDDGVMARVRDTENAYASRLTASTGIVPSSGPRGPGDFVGPSVGSMPNYAWSNPGFNFIYRSWNVVAENGAAVFDLEVSGGLEHPLFVVHGVASDQASLELDGALLTPEVDYVKSYDGEGQRLWVSLLQSLPAGSHQFVVGGASDTQSTSATSSTTSGVETSGATGSGGGAGAAETGSGSTVSSAANGSGGTSAAGASSTGGASSTLGDATGGAAEGSEDASGCSCRTLPRRGPEPWLPWVLAPTLLVAVRRLRSRPMSA